MRGGSFMKLKLTHLKKLSLSCTFPFLKHTFSYHPSCSYSSSSFGALTFLNSSHPHLSSYNVGHSYFKCSPHLRPTFLCDSQRVLFSSMESPENSMQCWACGERKSDRPFLVCPSCKALQHPDPSTNFFHIFDLDPKYELDLGKLEARYKGLMKKLHPDLYHWKSQKEQANSAILSATVTRAYQVLLKPVSRATYMLQLQGIHVEEEGTVHDPELLMEVMDMREALEETSDPKTLEQLYNKAKSGMEEWEKSLVTALNEDRNDAAVSALQRMSYYDRLSREIKRKML